MTSIKVVNGLGDGADEVYIKFTEKNLRVIFPSLYKECVKQTDQGTFELPVFRYIDPYSKKERKSIIGGLSSFDPAEKYNILRQYFLMPNFFPKSLIPFAEVGNGDLICFDYSVAGFDDQDPPVVLWIHDNPEGQEVADLAINFETFLEKLEPEGEIES